MRRKTLVDLVSRYVDELNITDAGIGISTQKRAWGNELKDLVPIIEQTRQALAPVEPSSYFKEVLRAKLVAAWHEQRRQAQTDRLHQEERRGFFIRAAAIGSFISFAAVVAVVVRSRNGHVRV